MSRAEDGKCLLAWMREHSLAEYGSVVPQYKVREVLGLDVPKLADKQTFDELALRELSATDYVRNVLLGEGKYFGFSKGEYRILLPSENAAQVESYMHTADSKLKRALKLLRNTPAQDVAGPPSNMAARILMKRESIRAHRSSD